MPDPVAAELAAIRERAGAADALLGVPDDTGRLLAAVEAALKVHEEFEGRCTTCLEFCTCTEDALDDAPMATGEMHRKVFEAWDSCPHGNTPWPCPTYRAISRALLREEMSRD